MIKPSLLVAISAAGLFGAAAVAQQDTAVQTRKAMIDGINPAALAIWDVTNAAMDDQGRLDPARIDAEGWGRIEDAARMLEVYGNRMAAAQRIVAGGPDLISGELPPGVASKEQIQAMIDADKDGFRAVSADLAAQAASLVTAARARNPDVTSELVSGIDEACQTCHTRYWYLQERAAD